MPGGKQPGWHGRAVGLLPLLRVCSDPPAPLPLQRPQGKLRHRYPADAAHPCWLQLPCPSRQEALVWPLGMARSHVEVAGPAGHLTLRCAGMGAPSSGASHGELGLGTVWAWHPSGILGTPFLRCRGLHVSLAATVALGRGIPIPPISPIPFQPTPGISSPCQPRSPGDGPSAAGFPDSRLPGRNVPGGSGPRPPGPLPLSALLKRLPARPARPGHGSHEGDRDLCGHRPPRPPPHPGVPRLRRRLHLPPHRRAHRHLPQIG